MTGYSYHRRDAFPSSYNSKEQYFRDLREELDLWGSMASDDRISEVIDPTGDDFRDTYSDILGSGHFIRVRITGDHNRTWPWPITDRGLAYIHSRFSKETVTNVLRDLDYSDTITVAETDSGGRVKHPIETTDKPDKKSAEYFKPDPDSV